MRRLFHLAFATSSMLFMAYVVGCSSLLSVTSTASSCPALAASKGCEDCTKSNCAAELNECFGGTLTSNGGSCGAYNACLCKCDSTNSDCITKCDSSASQACKTCIDKYKTCRTAKCNPQCKETVISNQSDASADSKPLGAECQTLQTCCASLTDTNEQTLCKAAAAGGVESGCNAALKDFQSKGKCT